MTQPFVGEIQVFGFDFAPMGWAPCNGQLLPIQQNTALFSLLGTTYGGNGTTTFALPNLMGRGACNRGQGAGLTDRYMGETFGQAAVSLTDQEMPSHVHALTLYAQNDQTRRTSSPTSGSALSNPGNGSTFVSSTPTVSFAANLIGTTGSGLPHENQQPYLATNICIALQGIFPSFD